MVLKYRSFGQNWTLIESPLFSYAKLMVPRWESPEPRTSDEELAMIEQRHRDIREFIIEQTGAPVDNVHFLVDGRTCDIRYCTAVISHSYVPVSNLVTGESGPVVYVINTEAYLMTDTGKTIERIS